MKVISLKNVSCSYPETEVFSLKNVSLDIEEGELLVLCGKSGCGKTTLIRLINGLIPFYYPGKLQGSVKVMGHETAEGSIYDLGSRVSTVFQNPRTQFFCVDVMSELAFGAENRNIPRAEILKSIETAAKKLNIESLLPRTMFRLSGGEKQKIACACVSVTDNPIVVLDEPSSNLDMFAVEELKSMISMWKAQGKTIVIAEHRLEYLKKLADRFLYMKDGEIVKSYEAGEFTALPENELEARGLRALDYSRLCIVNNTKPNGSLELQDLCFKYKGAEEESLRVDRLTLPKAAVIGIIGKNGAGKSTLVRNFCGLQKHAGGALWEDSKRYGRRKRLLRSFLVMQDVNHQLFTQSVEEEISLSMGREDKEELEGLLEEFDLTELKDKHPMALSGGQKQRVAVASAVASGRDFIAFDEPTSGLDLIHMKEVARSILKLQKKGKTILLITHDIELIYACCSHVLHMEKGRVKDLYPLNKGTERRLREFFKIT